MDEDTKLKESWHAERVAKLSKPHSSLFAFDITRKIRRKRMVEDVTPGTLPRGLEPTQRTGDIPGGSADYKESLTRPAIKSSRAGNNPRCEAYCAVGWILGWIRTAVSFKLS